MKIVVITWLVYFGLIISLLGVSGSRTIEDSGRVVSGMSGNLYQFHQEYLKFSVGGERVPLHVDEGSDFVLTVDNVYRPQQNLYVSVPNYSIEPFIEGEPDGMVLEVDGFISEILLRWQTPFVSEEPVEFSFIFGVVVSGANGGIIEVLKRSVVVTVFPVKPRIAYDYMLANGIR